MILRKLFFVSVEAFSDTNLEISMPIKGEKCSVPVDLLSSKMVSVLSGLNLERKCKGFLFPGTKQTICNLYPP